LSHCKAKTEVYSRIVGYYRPVQQWNIGKQEEFRKRKVYRIDTSDYELYEFPAASDAKMSDKRVSGNVAN
jgi:ribonucleoside-triphosphate reductase (formate)